MKNLWLSKVFFFNNQADFVEKNPWYFLVKEIARKQLLFSVLFS